MKKRIRSFLAALAAVALVTGLSPAAYAATAQIRDIDTHVVLAQDGSASITQTWDVTVSSGTEYYINQENLGDIVIENLRVRDENGTEYQNIGDWDIDRSISEKAGKCGIVTKDDGAELCWGIGRYGDHVFTVSYTMTNLVKGFTDYGGFNQRFVNDQLSSPPQHMMVTIEKEGYDFVPEETGVWAFGFIGDINVLDGKIVAESIQPMDSASYVNIMARFQAGLFTPTSQDSRSFAQLEEEAKRGSDYTTENDQNGGVVEYPQAPPYTPHYKPMSPFQQVMRAFGSMVTVLFNMGLIAAIFFIITKIGVKNKALSIQSEPFPKAKNIPYARDIPCKGSIPGAYFALKQAGRLDNETTILGAYLLRWTKLGVVRVEEATKTNWLGFTKTEPSIVLLGEEKLTAPGEKQLYDMIAQAAGGDGILQETEFQKWANTAYDTMDKWTEEEIATGTAYFERIGGLEIQDKTTFLGLIKYQERCISPTGRQEIMDTLGFYNYLKDFTVINERHPVEVELWDDYLVFATLFGIADQVSKDFKELYPRYFETAPMGGGYRDPMTTILMVNAMSRAGYRGVQEGHSRAARAARGGSRSFGGGGSSSFGGGGGFSGGGHGGGSR